MPFDQNIIVLFLWLLALCLPYIPYSPTEGAMSVYIQERGVHFVIRYLS